MDITKRAEHELSTLKLTIILYGFTFAIIITGYYLTGIMVLLADALHSLSDLFVYSFLLVAMIWSRKEADEVHSLATAMVCFMSLFSCELTQL